VIYKMARLVVLTAVLVLITHSDISVCIASSKNPRVLTPQQISGIITSLPTYAHFSIVDMHFFNRKLYVGTNIGLLELETESPVRLYRWLESDAVVEGPWFDSAHNLLWFWLPSTNNLIHFNGSEWIDGSYPRMIIQGVIC